MGHTRRIAVMIEEEVQDDDSEEMAESEGDSIDEESLSAVSISQQHWGKGKGKRNKDRKNAWSRWGRVEFSNG